MKKIKNDPWPDSNLSLDERLKLANELRTPCLLTIRILEKIQKELVLNPDSKGLYKNVLFIETRIIPITGYTGGRFKCLCFIFSEVYKYLNKSAIASLFSSNVLRNFREIAKSDHNYSSTHGFWWPPMPNEEESLSLEEIEELINQSINPRIGFMKELLAFTITSPKEAIKLLE